MNPDLVPRAETFSGRNLNRLLLVLLGVGVISLLATVITGLVAPAGSEVRRQFAFSWLFAFIYFFTILAGCFFWLILHHSTDSSWGILVRRQMENLAALIPWMAIFFIPLFLARHDIWDWIDARHQVPLDPHLGGELEAAPRSPAEGIGTSSALTLHPGEAGRVSRWLAGAPARV